MAYSNETLGGMSTRVAKKLLQDLMKGEIAGLGIKEIRSELLKEENWPSSGFEWTTLEIATIRKVVEGVK